MHIGLQSSGGRGEYEVAGSQSGFNAAGLEGFTFSLNWPDGIVRETGLHLEPGESGKPRLRSLLDDPFQIGRMTAAMLLLPDPRRALRDTHDSLPIVRAKGYVISRVGFGPNTEFSPVVDMVTIEPTFVNVANREAVEPIGVDHRWARIQEVYARAAQYPVNVRTELDRHRKYLASGATVTKDLTAIVTSLAREIEAFDARFSKDDDPLIALEILAVITLTDGPTLPPPDELGEDEPEVSARSAFEYRLAKIRSGTARRFASAVRSAYGHRCAFCGGQYGGISGIPSGIDAAHILAWSNYDLDTPSNGIALCKTHHWAFDATLIVPEFWQGDYRLRFTTLSEQFPNESMRLLGHDQFVIPTNWLPADASLRPSRQYLERLYEDLAIDFVA